jgi:hypothetical protein
LKRLVHFTQQLDMSMETTYASLSSGWHLLQGLGDFQYVGARALAAFPVIQWILGLYSSLTGQPQAATALPPQDLSLLGSPFEAELRQAHQRRNLSTSANPLAMADATAPRRPSFIRRLLWWAILALSVLWILGKLLSPARHPALPSSLPAGATLSQESPKSLEVAYNSVQTEAEAR